MTNRQFSESQEFKTICANNGVPPTKRAASKVRLGHGRLAAAVGQSSRTPPPGPKHYGWTKWTTTDENGKVTRTKWYEDKATRIALV